MAQGRLGRSTSRYPSTRRRSKTFGNSRYGHRGRGLPPHLMPGVRNEVKPEGVFTRRNFIIASFTIGLVVTLSLLAITISSGMAAAFGVVRQYRKVNEGLPAAGPIFVNTFQTTRIYDRKGTLLQEVDNPDYGWRTFVDMDNMSEDFINATVAAEDATFWSNYGIEPVAFLRAGVIMFTGAGSSGASTITQQLVRATYPEQISSNDLSIDRKFREALAAVAMAQEYSKEDILTMYVNQIYYGARSYGVEAAANTYFEKHASELTLAESALLAGLPQSPSFYAPNNPDGFQQAKIRQGYVLDQMVKYRYITPQQREEAWNEPLNVIQEQRVGYMRAAPHFTQYIHNYIIENYGEEALYGGLNIYTSIDLDLQAEAEAIVATGVANMAQYNRNNAAAVVMTPWNGEILAMVGSADFNNAAIGGQVNFTTSGIQPGSSMKPIAYAAAFEKGWNPATVLMDVPTEWPNPGAEPYAPNNYTKSFYGAVSVRESLANSFNIGAVKATDYAGVEGVLDISRRMGLKKSFVNDASWYGVSLGLGSGEVHLLEHTNAYATLANNGRYVPATPIQRIEDSRGNVIRETSPDYIDSIAEQAIEPGIAYQVTSILTDNEARARIFTTDNRFGNTQSELGRPTAAKSGTTENWRDLWTMGYTTDVAIGAWVGRSGDDGTATNLTEIDGIQAAGPIWQDLMFLVHRNPAYQELLLGADGTPVPEQFPEPGDVRQMDLCKVTGHLPGGGETTRDWVVRGKEPSLNCNQIDEREAEELALALEQLRKGASWSGGAVESINRYASMVGREPVRMENESEDGSFDDSSDDSFDDSSEWDTGEPTTDDTWETDDPGSEDVPIEPIN